MSVKCVPSILQPMEAFCDNMTFSELVLYVQTSYQSLDFIGINDFISEGKK